MKEIKSGITEKRQISHCGKPQTINDKQQTLHGIIRCAHDPGRGS